MSIRLRLTLYWAAVLTLILLAAGVAVLALFERQQWGQLDGALMEEADTAASTIARLGPGAADSIARRLSQERDLGPSRRVRLSSGGRIVADYGNRASDLPVGDLDRPSPAMRDASRRAFRFAIVPFTLAGEPAWLADGVDVSPIRGSIARLRTTLILIIPLLLIVCVSGGYWLAGRALVPITTLAASLARIEPRDLSGRLAVGIPKDEVARLTRVINALLDRVERAATAERRFATDAAHELRTPLTVLRTGLEVALGRERSSGEYAEALNAALHEAVALCGMADELLALSRLDQEASIERSHLNLRTLVQEVIEAIEPLVNAKNLVLATTLESVVVDGSPSHLRRLLINLLDNALKFTPERGRIAITLEAREGRAILRVTNSGPGIAPADLPLVFERFFRGKTQVESGSGLGLSLCCEIVRLHKGEISAVSAAGDGTEFVVTLPAGAPI
jgi:signal transduction histidine kinase